MLQHQHILLTLIFLLPLYYSADVTNKFILVSIIMIFSVLPDIDISGNKFVNLGTFKKSAILDYLKFLNIFTNLIRTLIFIPYDFILKLILRKNKTYHRESSHSLIFLATVLLVIVFITSLLFPFIKSDLGVLFSYILIAAMAFIMHLFQDSLTVNGIKWLYPLENIEIKGKLNTSNTLHMRLVDFYIALILISIIIYHTVDNLKTLPEQFFQFYQLWSNIYPNHTYLLAIPLFLLIREVKISL